MSKKTASVATAKKTLRNPGMVYFVSFFAMAIVNAVILFFAGMFFPGNVVLGNMSLTEMWAVILASGTLSLINMLIIPFLSEIELRRRKNFSAVEMIGVFLVLDFISVWLVTRASDVFGVGVSSWVVVLILAVVMDFFQGAVMSAVEKMKYSL